LGWVEGQNLTVERRYAEDHPEQLSDLAAQLVNRHVDLIVAEGTSPSLAARKATATIPIVFLAAGDPLGVGLVATLARPGGNATGLSLQSTQHAPKQIEFLMALVPGLTRIGIILNDNAGSLLALAAQQQAAHAVDVEVLPLFVRSADDLEDAFTRGIAWRAEGLILRGDLFFLSQAPRIVSLATSNHLPVIYPYREHVMAGGLMALGPDLGGIWRRGATYVDKILRGRAPADLPVEQLESFPVTVNLKTAQMLGLTVPREVAAQVTEWVQ
jgi:putative ABC transport system substrate-binding protein